MQQWSNKCQISLLNPMSGEEVPTRLSIDKSQTFRGTRKEQLDPLSFFTQRLILTCKCDTRSGAQSGQSSHYPGVFLCHGISDVRPLLEVAAIALVSKANSFFLLIVLYNMMNFVLRTGSIKFWS